MWGSSNHKKRESQCLFRQTLGPHIIATSTVSSLTCAFKLVYTYVDDDEVFVNIRASHCWSFYANYLYSRKMWNPITTKCIKTYLTEVLFALCINALCNKQNIAMNLFKEDIRKKSTMTWLTCCLNCHHKYFHNAFVWHLHKIQPMLPNIKGLVLQKSRKWALR